MKFIIFPSASSSYTLYQDDGESTDYIKGEYSLTEISVNQNETEIVVNVNSKYDSYDSGLETYEVYLRGVSFPVKEILFNDKIVEKWGENPDQYYISDKGGTVFIKTPYEKEIIIVVK
jgi:hypothetical protein